MGQMSRMKIRLIIVIVLACLLASFGQTGEASPEQQTGTPTLVLNAPNEIIDAAWSPDGRWITARTWENTLYIWDGQSGVLVASVPHKNSWPSRWSPDGHYLVTWVSDTAWVWEAGTWGTVSVLPLSFFIYDVFWKPDSLQLAVRTPIGSGTLDESYHVFDTLSGAEQLVLSVYAGTTHSDFLWSPDGRFGVSTGDGIVAAQVWDMTTGAELTNLRQPGSLSWFANNTTAMWSRDGERLLVNGVQGGAIVVDVPNQTTLFSLQDDSLIVLAYWNPNDDLMFGLTRESRHLPIWDGQTGELLRYLTSDWLFIWATWSRDGQYIFATVEDGNRSSQLTIWEAATGELIGSTEFHDEIFIATWSADESLAANYVASPLDRSEETKVIRPTTGEVLLSFGPNDVLIWHPTANRLLRVTMPEFGCEADCQSEVQVWDVR